MRNEAKRPSLPERPFCLSTAALDVKPRTAVSVDTVYPLQPDRAPRDWAPFLSSVVKKQQFS